MGLFTDWIISGNAQTPKRLRRGGYEGVWRGLLAGVDQRASDLDRVAARGMLLECDDGDDLDWHLRQTGDRRQCGETDAEARAYLAQRWTAHKEAGTPEGLLRQLRRLHLDNVLIVRELDLRHAGIAGAFGGNRGFYFLVILQPSPFTDPANGAPLWAGGGTWAGGGVWGGLPPGFIDCLRAGIRRWEPAGHSCRYVLVAQDYSFVWDPVTFTFTGNGVTYPIGKRWEWQFGFQPYYSSSYATP